MGLLDFLKNKKEPINAARFVELMNGEINNPRVIAEYPDFSRKLYQVDFMGYVPPDCKIATPFICILDLEYKTVYAVEPSEDGFYNFVITGKYGVEVAVEVNTSRITSVKSKFTVVGKVDLKLARLVYSVPPSL